MTRMLSRWFTSTAFILILVGASNAQNSNEPQLLSDVYLLKNVFIIKSPETPPYFGEILVDDGLIKQISKQIKAPYDAQVMDLDSMYVYAGFIDGLSRTGIPKPEERDRKEAKDPGNPSNEMAGITPEKRASGMYSNSEKSIEAMRKAGITLSHSAPYGRMLPGSGMLALNSGDSKEMAMVKDDVSCFSQFVAAPGVYPGNKIAVMAKWRELYNQAKFADKHINKYKNAKKGMERPDYDEATLGMIPVVNKGKAIFFKAEDLQSVYQVMSLKKDLGFNLVVTELKQGWKAIDDLKAIQAQVLLSLDIPASEKKKEEESDKKEDATKADAEKEKLIAKRDKAISEYQMQAGKFEKANIPFAFSFLESKPKDLHKNIRIAIENGLSEKGALAALTTNAAKMLGVSDIVGTVENGKIANLVITDKPYFEEKAKIKFVFVDGKKFEMEEKKKKKKKSGDGEGEEPNVVGTWSYEIEAPTPNNTGSMTITKEEDVYTVTVKNPADGAEEAIEDVELSDGGMSFSFSVPMGDFDLDLSWDLTFDGDSFEGNVTAGDFGTFPVKGDRTSESPNN